MTNGTPKPAVDGLRVSEDRDLTPRDWFVAAIEHNGSVGDCLGAVLTELGERSRFIATLKGALVGPSGKGIDAITELAQKIRGLENTLRFRLGILRPERPQAWFRAPATTSTGPFSSTLLEEPVFAPYDAPNTETVRLALSEAWRARQVDRLPFKDQSSCLWRTLLGFNAELESIASLPAPYAGMTLAELPAGLPPLLESRALRAFLINVRTEVAASRERLEACFKQLWETSEKLWTYQLEDLKRTKRPEPSERPRVYNAAAENMREELRRRRTAAQLKPLLTPADLDALKFMGFDDLPSADSLRQRYIAMAKRLHPDRQGGNDHAFKILSTAYAQLTGRIEGSGRRPD